MNKKYFQYINLILDFYRNSELNLEFDNGFFKEGNAEEWVLPRLERAVKKYLLQNDNMKIKDLGFCST